MLSTALLPVVVSKADTATNGTKAATAKKGQAKDSSTNPTSQQQNTYVQASENQVDSNKVAVGSSLLREETSADELTKLVGATSAATMPLSVSAATSQGSQATSSVTSQVSQAATSSATSQASAVAESSSTSQGSQETTHSASSDQSQTASSAVTAQGPKARLTVTTSQASQSSASSETSQSSQTSASSATSQSSQSSASSAASQSSQSSASSASSQATSEAAETESDQPKVQTNNTLGPGYYDDNVLMSAALFGYQDKFFDEIKAGAISGWQKYGVLPSITAAQAILESGWGRSQLSTEGNNLFGIKGSYNGQSISFPTQEWGPNGYYTVNAAFRKYPNWSASVEDHGRFLDENSRYSNLLGERDYQKVARLLQQDGYATDPNYANALINMVNSYGLQSWDQEVANITPGDTGNSGNNNGNNTDNGNSNNNNNSTDTNSGRYVFKEKTDIHAEATMSSAVVGSYGAGESVYYSAKVEADGYTWLKYQAYSGKTHYVAISGTGNQNNNNNNSNNGGQTNVTNESGNFKFTAKTTIRNAASKSAQAVGTYNAGESVHYTGKVDAEGLTWLKYVAYSGATHYVATTGDTVETPNQPNVVPASGSYRFNYDTAIKTAPQTNAQTVGTYRAGETVYYNGKVTAEGQTWLRYQSYSGAVHYVAINDGNNNQDTKPVVVLPQTGSYRFTATTAIKTAPDNNAQTVGTYYAGNTVYYNGKVTVNGQTWLRYQSNSGGLRYVAIGGNVSSSTPAQDIAASGSYRFTQTTAIKSAPNATASTVGTYGAGDAVYYNGKVIANGQTWLKYQAYSGATHYVAISGAANAGTTTVTTESGAFRFTTATDIRQAPSMSAGVVGRYNQGETVYYNGTVKAEGRTWLKYLSYSGATHYVPR